MNIQHTVKRYSYCGKEYSEQATVCAIDRTPLDRQDEPPTEEGVEEGRASSNNHAYVSDWIGRIVVCGIVIFVYYYFSHDNMKHDSGLMRLLGRILSRGHYHE